MKKRVLLSVLRCLILCFVLFSVAEGVARLAGYKPINIPKTRGFLSFFEKDDVTGWRHRPGVYVIPGTSEKEKETIFTIWPGSMRATHKGSPINYSSDKAVAGKQKFIVLLGGSFTVGGGINDDETFAWLVQETFPQIEVLNYGTGGYGTCQSFLRMKEIIDTLDKHPSIFLYGFPDFHETRNIAHPQYVWRLARNAESKTTYMPYCGIDNQQHLKIYPPEYFFPLIPFGEQSAALCLLEEFYYKVKALPREKHQVAVTEKIILEMNQLARQNGCRFIVLIMRHDNKSSNHYLSFFKRENIEYIDGTHPEQNTSKLQIADGHPNSVMNKIWADQLIDYFKRAGLK